MPTCMFSSCYFIPENINMKHMHNCTVQSCDLVCVRYASSRNAIITDGIPIIKLGQLQLLSYRYSKELTLVM